MARYLKKIGIKWRIDFCERWNFMKDFYNRNVIATMLDADTGEFLSQTKYANGCRIQSQEEVKQKKDFYDKKHQQQLLNVLKKKQINEIGEFIWSVYYINTVYNPCNISEPNITRLMYLATFIDYDGYLLKPNSPQLFTNQNKEYMDKHDMKNIMGLKPRTFTNFYNEVILDKKLFTISDDNKYKINDFYFSKGIIDKTKIRNLAEHNSYITKLYIKGVRELYAKATPTSHKTLSYLFQIIPYVNRKYNIVCHNPLETDLKKVEPMTLGEFCKTIGYDESHSNRLFSTLFEPMFATDDGNVQSAVRYVATKGTSKKTYNIFINPRVYYAGDNWKEIEVLGVFN